MATQLQIRRGTSAQVAAFTGAEGEVVVNTTNDSLVVNDGSTAGGFEMARVDGSNWAITNNISTTANISFGDNDKAIFGSGSDLEIFHDGSHSYVRDSGTGHLKLQGTDVRIQSADGAENFLVADLDGAVKLYNNDAQKFQTTSTGIDVTGTVTADGLTVDGDGSFAGDFEISGLSPKIFLSETDTTDVNTRIRNAAGKLQIQTVDNSDANPVNRFQIDHATGDISFYNSSGTSQSLFWDSSAESLGIGTTSPNASARLHIGKSGGSPELWLERTDGYLPTKLIANTLGNGQGFKINVAGADALAIDSSQRVGIGTDSPSKKLVISDGGAMGVEISPDDSGNGYSRIINYDRTTNQYEPLRIEGEILQFSTGTTATEKARLDASGNLLVGTTTSSGKLTVDGDTRLKFTYPIADNSYDLGTSSFRWRDLYLSGAANVGGNIVSSANNFIYSHNGGSSGTVRSGFKLEGSSNTLVFYTGATERARIDSSGNLLVGTTDAAVGVGNTNVGHSIGAAGYAAHSRSGNASLFLNRTGTDGIIASFRKDGAPVGSIGAAVGNAYFSGTARGWTFGGSNLYPANQVGAKQDNNTDLGHGSYRFDDIYATNGTIQTSDRNEKQDIEALSDAEQRVAVAAKGLLRKFRWINSVEENGDDARIHFGIIAQDLQDAFTAEGLDAGRYAMFISSTWTDEDGNEQTRLGVRYSELLAFIISAT
jgi:hypothetical protein